MFDTLINSSLFYFSTNMFNCPCIKCERCGPDLKELTDRKESSTSAYKVLGGGAMVHLRMCGLGLKGQERPFQEGK